jgi:hypothetical protein
MVQVEGKTLTCGMRIRIKHTDEAGEVVRLGGRFAIVHWDKPFENGSTESLVTIDEGVVLDR